MLLDAGQHGSDWVTPLVALEAAGRLLANYGSDPQTTSLVNNLDIFIVPAADPGRCQQQHVERSGVRPVRKNMLETCAPGLGGR